MTSFEFLHSQPVRIEGNCPDCGNAALASFALSAVFKGGMKDYGPIEFCVVCESD